MLTADQLTSYRDDGYLLVEGLLDPDEAAGLRAECHALAGRLAEAGAEDPTWGSARALAPHTRLVHCHAVQFHAAAFARLLVDERFTAAAADVLGGPDVQLHHTKMFIKPPERGSAFPLHQDHPYFPHTRHTVTAAIFHLDDAPPEKGCVRLVPGSHRQGPLAHETEGSFHLPPQRYPLDSAVPCPARAGDVLFFSYLTVHGSGVNVSDEARTTLLVQFRDPRDRRTGGSTPRGEGAMLRGIDPRPAAASG